MSTQDYNVPSVFEYLVKRDTDGKIAKLFKFIMLFLYEPFTDVGGFSWRKAMAAIFVWVFAYSCVTYLMAHEFKEALPDYYLYVIWFTVFVYFAKDLPVGILNAVTSFFASKTTISSSQASQTVTDQTKTEGAVQ